jgi:hypothetical protein
MMLDWRLNISMVIGICIAVGLVLGIEEFFADCGAASSWIGRAYTRKAKLPPSWDFSTSFRCGPG